VTKSIPLEPSLLPGVGLLRPPFHQDGRGSFTKPYSPEVLAALAAPFPIAEVYWSQSGPGTVRGMHFQVPPTPIAKIVFATAGKVRDVVLDLRVGSPAFGEFAVFDLAPGSGAVVVPHGCAHGFEVTEGPAVLVYLQDGAFDPATDAGIRWDSFGMDWLVSEPTLSARDPALPSLADFESPFVWTGA